MAPACGALVFMKFHSDISIAKEGQKLILYVDKYHNSVKNNRKLPKRDFLDTNTSAKFELNPLKNTWLLNGNEVQMGEQTDVCTTVGRTDARTANVKTKYTDTNLRLGIKACLRVLKNQLLLLKGKYQEILNIHICLVFSKLLECLQMIILLKIPSKHSNPIESYGY